MAVRARAVLLIVVGVAIVFTVIVALVPDLSFGYRAPRMHVAIEAGAAVTALIAAFLIYGRLVRSNSGRDLALCVGLVVLGLGNLARAFAPSFNGDNNEVVWIPATASTVVAGGALVVAAFAPEVYLRRTDRRLIYIAWLVVATGAAVAVVAALSDRIPTGIDPNLSPAAASHPRIVGSDVLLSVQGVGFVLFGAAAVGLANRAARTGDELMAWFALGAGLASVARVNYFLFPSVYSGWVFTGDFLRALAFTAVLIGSIRQIAANQREALRVAIADERRRIGRDLQEGLAQDLADLALQGTRLSRDEDARQIAHTAQEALFQARAVISDMRLSDAPLASAVARLSKALAGRHEVRLELELDPAIDGTPEERQALLRILSEAISNAVRHGEASQIGVALKHTNEGSLSMSIADDGRGFDPSTAHGAGLDGMRARIEGLGGGFEARSRPGMGSRVEVLLDQSRKPGRAVPQAGSSRNALG